MVLLTEAALVKSYLGQFGAGLFFTDGNIVSSWKMFGQGWSSNDRESINHFQLNNQIKQTSECVN